MVEDNECLCTIEEIASLFGTKAKHRGFLMASGAKIHSNRGEKEVVWWPNTEHPLWLNKLSEDGLLFE